MKDFIWSCLVISKEVCKVEKAEKLPYYSCEYSCFTCLHIRFHSIQTRDDFKILREKNRKTFQLGVCLPVSRSARFTWL